MDTPGVFDTHSDKDKIAKEIIKCLGVVAPGPHAIILVLRFGVRFTEEENKAVEEVNKVRQLVLIFCCVSVLELQDGVRGKSLYSWDFYLCVFLFVFFCVPQLYLWGSPLLGEILRM